jgi:hypothetical protein
VVFIDFRTLEEIEFAPAFFDAVFNRQDLAEQPGAQGHIIRVIAAVIEIYAVIIVEANNLSHRLFIELKDT